MPAVQPRGQRLALCPTPARTRLCVDRWELLSLVTELRQELGLADRDVMVLRAHLSVLPQGPLDPGGLNISFMCVAEILARACGMDERRFRRGEARLAEAGLILRRLSGNGRRFPERDSSGRIVSAYGIDLTPVISRCGELRMLASRLEEERRALRQRKNSLSARFSAVLRDLSAQRRALPDRLEQLRSRLRKTLRRKAPDPSALSDLEAEVAELERMVTAESAPPSADSSAEDDGQTVRHIESEPKDRNAEGLDRFDPIRFAESWSRARNIRALYPDTPRRRSDAAAVFLEVAGFLRLDRQTLAQALAAMGWHDTLGALDYLIENGASIQRPTGYLRSIISAYRPGAGAARRGGRSGPPRNVPVAGLPG